MDAQKIAEAASTIKKADLATEWFKRINDCRPNPIELSKTVVIDTVGVATGWHGHSEASPYLRKAMDIHRESILDYAAELAQADKVKAKQVIREEAGA